MIHKIWIILLILLAGRIIWQFGQLTERSSGEEISIETTVESEPQIINFRQQFSTQGLTVSAPMKPIWHYGDRVKITGRLMCYDTFRCIRGRIDKAKIEGKGKNEFNWARGANLIRRRIQKVYFDSLPRQQANLLSGIVVGGIDLDRKFKDQLAMVGLTHVVAASGMNVTLFAGFLIWSFMRLHGKRLAVILTILGIIFYCGIAGFSPAVVRAGIMACGSLMGLLVGRRNASLGGLTTAGYVMLWVEPMLIFDFGFLLSFASMVGQISVSNMRWNLPMGISWGAEILAQTGAAILFTFPIVVIGFGKFSIFSLVTNMLVLWTVEPLMILGGIAGIGGIVWVELAKLILIPGEILLSYFLGIVNFFALREFVLEIRWFNWVMAVGYYLVLGGMVIFRKSSLPRFLGLR